MWQHQKTWERENPWCIFYMCISWLRDDLMCICTALYVLVQFHFVMCAVCRTPFIANFMLYSWLHDCLGSESSRFVDFVRCMLLFYNLTVVFFFPCVVHFFGSMLKFIHNSNKWAEKSPSENGIGWKTWVHSHQLITID